VRASLAVVVMLVACLVLSTPALAQYPLGTVSAVTTETCPSTLGGAATDWVTNTSGGTDIATTCYHATVSCPQLPDLGITYGVATPSTTSSGTIVFIRGSGGTITLPGNVNKEVPFDMFHDGYQTIQAGWDDWWQLTGWTDSGSFKVAACREATFLNYMYTAYYQTNTNNSSTAGMCVHAQSAAAGALALSMTYYGAGDFIDKAVFISGPQYGNLVQGCVPNQPLQSVCTPTGKKYPNGCSVAAGSFSEYPNYYTGSASNIGRELGDNPPCDDTNHTYTSGDITTLTDTSLVDGLSDASYSFPQTAVAAYECDDDIYFNNPTSLQGWYWLSQLSTPAQTANTCNYGKSRTPNPTACMIMNRVYGCTEVEQPSTGFICQGGNCPVCTGTPPNISCTCGGKTCSASQTPNFAMRNVVETDYKDALNGCIARHGTASRN
jgi:hypothetical protein